MTNAITTAATPDEIIEQVVVSGDLAKLTPAQRVNYYNRVCNSMGLNPLTRPFDYITLNGKLTLYAKRDAADQLRKLHGVSVQIASRERIEDVFSVTAHAVMPDGRTDESIGAVSLTYPETISVWEGSEGSRRKVDKPHPKAGQPLKSDELANALMKAETKAKRRVTLSIVGLGWLDETEVETIRDARPVAVDTSTGEIITAQVRTVPDGNGQPAQSEEIPALLTEGQRKRLHGLGSTAYGPDWDTKRHELVTAITKGRTDSSKLLSEAEAAALIRGIEKKLDSTTVQVGEQAPAFPADSDLHPASAHLEPA